MVRITGIRYVFPLRPLLLPGAVHLNPAAGGAGSEESAAVDGTCVTCGMAVLMDHHCPVCLGTVSSWLDCILSHYYWFGTLG